MHPTTSSDSSTSHDLLSSARLAASNWIRWRLTRSGITTTLSRGTPAPTMVSAVPSATAKIRRARRAANAYAVRAGPRRICAGTGPHSAHTTRPVSRCGSSERSSCSFLKLTSTAPTGRSARSARAIRTTLSGACSATRTALRLASFGPRSISLTGTLVPAASSGMFVNRTTSCPRSASASRRSTFAYSAPPRSLVVWIETIRSPPTRGHTIQPAWGRLQR